ncbi:MAG: hypothetical protein LBG96_01275 [Tannerella sp.]|jgi:hypothetical protein|nr:hypothetical protein [Tannerella sp.]
MEIQINKAVIAIDSIITIALKWMNATPSFVRNEIMKVFYAAGPERVSHYIDEWNGEFASYYLNMDEDMRRKLFNYYAIELEPDKYTPDSDEFYMATLTTGNKFEVYPFESHIVHLFFLTAYNNSLELLKNPVTIRIQPDCS